MKNFYLLILALFAMKATLAQIVEIPDPNFKDALLNHNPKIDLNDDGEIQISEAEAATKVDVKDQNIESLVGIEAFANLTWLSCDKNKIVNLDLSKNIALTTLICSNNQIVNLNLTNNIALTHLSCQYNQLEILNIQNNDLLIQISCYVNKIKKLSLSNKKRLTILYCASNQLENIDVTNNLALHYLSCSNNQFKNLDLIKNKNLVSLSCGSNQLQSLDISKNPSLTYLACSNNQIKFLDVTHNLDLVHLECFNNQLEKLNLVHNEKLTKIWCSYNKLEELDISKNSKLSVLKFDGNQIQDIDLTNNHYLNELRCGFNQLAELNLTNNPELVKLSCGQNTLKTLSIKNGNNLFENLNYCENDNSIAYFYIQNSPNLEYICADEEELDCVQKIVDSLGYTNCLVGTDCDVEPNYLVTGESRFDAEKNGCDATDYILPAGQKFTVSNGNTTHTFIGSNSGKHTIPFKEDGTYELTPAFENPGYFDASPANFTVNFPSDGSPFVQDVCITPNGTKNDLEVVLIPINRARPGVTTNYKLFFKNKGNTIQSGSITLVFEGDYMNFVSATPAVTSQTPNLLTWHFNGLLPLGVKEIELNMALNKPSDSPPLNGGETLNFEATINPTDNDLNPEDNVYSMAQRVVNSFDPNDKTCLEGDTIKPETVGHYIHYLIRFENKGTAEAVNIVINDVIDTLTLDINSLAPLDASHDFFTTITNGNEVAFIFEDINLPFDSANNKGYLLFKIKTLPSLLPGDVFENQAAIHFDFNLPIYTNTTKTVVQPIDSGCVSVRIPDANFEQALLDLNIDTDGKLNGKICKRDAEMVEKLNVANKNISDLTGIEFFVNLTSLSCNHNKLTSLELSNNSSLTYLACNANQLNSLNVSNCLNLDILYCYNNKLQALNISNNRALKVIACHKNEIPSLDISQNQTLKKLLCDLNQISDLDLSNNGELTEVSCSWNQLTNLDVTKNAKLKKISCFRNQLTKLDVSNNTQLTYLNCSYNKLTSLDVSNNPELTDLYCERAQLTNLDLSVNYELQKLICNNNQLTKLAVASPVLKEVYCQKNNLNTLNLMIVQSPVAAKKFSHNLEKLIAYENNLKTLDLRHHRSLKTVRLQNNNLQTLNLNNENNHNLINLSINNNPNLWCVVVDNIGYAKEQVANGFWVIDNNRNFWFENSCATIDETPLNLEQKAPLVAIKIFPNPTSGDLNIITPESIQSIAILDLSGRTVQEIPTSGKSKETKINLIDLPKGSYLLHIKTDEYKLIEKLFVR